MSVVDLRRGWMACDDPLGAHHEDRDNHVDKDHGYDGAGICAVPTLSNVSRDGISGRSRRGKCAIKRAAIVLGSRCADGPSGVPRSTRPIFELPFPSATELIRKPPRQGSTSNRASADSTLSGMSFPSSPIGANKSRRTRIQGPKSKEWAPFNLPDCVAAIEHKERQGTRQCCCITETGLYCEAAFHVRFGIYLYRRQARRSRG